jgi:2',3'-cyclic-nucleotide 2'-phosphodiesterase (5'-nucleotidase family)
MFSLPRPFLLLFTFIAVLLPRALPAVEAKLTLLFTGDEKGQIDSLPLSDSSQPVGGMARRMTLINRIRQEVGSQAVVLVDSGNLLTGTAFADMTRGQVMCAAISMMGYDALAVGEGDFTYGKKSLLEYRKKFRIPWVSANVHAGLQPFLRDYELKPCGVRVGLIGITNPDVPDLTNKQNVQGLNFIPGGAAIKGLHSIFKKDADLFIVLSRLGLDQDMKLAKDNSFLHVIISGNGDKLLKEPLVNLTKVGDLVGPLLVQSGNRGLYLGRLDLKVVGKRDRKTKKSEFAVVEYHYQMIPITSDIPEDPQMKALVDQYRKTLVDKPLDQVLATFTAPVASKGDCLLGQVVADSLREASGADIALIPTGTLSTTLNAGPFTRQDLYNLYSEEDSVCLVETSGAVIREAIKKSLELKGQAGFLQISGLTVQSIDGKLQLTLGTGPLGERQLYKVVTTDRLYMGQGGYWSLKKLRSRQKTNINFRDQLEQALTTRKTLSPSDLQSRWQVP